MRFLGVLCVFGGYILIYAAVAKGGVFATEPWNGILYDAYADNTIFQGAPGSAPGQQGPVTKLPQGRIRNNLPTIGG